MRLFYVLLITCCCTPAADSPFVGKWRIDESNSRPDPSGPGITAYVVAYSLDNGVLTGRAWASDGSARPNVVKYDGQDHAAAPKSVNPLGYTTMKSTDRGTTLDTLFKKHGKIVGSSMHSLSTDGRTMTVELHGTTVSGRKLHSKLLYHKE